MRSGVAKKGTEGADRPGRQSIEIGKNLGIKEASGISRLLGVAILLSRLQSVHVTPLLIRRFYVLSQ